MTSAWQVDRSWCRSGDGTWVSGGVPRRLWKLGGAGRRVADALERGDPLPAGHEPLTRRLVEAGALHPLPSSPGIPLTVSVVVPTRNPDDDALARLVCQVLGEFRGKASVVVVDDASHEPVTSRGATMIRTPHNTGPAGARNLGADRVEGDVIVFLDDDVELPQGWSTALLAHFDDPAVGAVAPRICGPSPRRRSTWWERSEQVRSPLDLGPEPAPVTPGGRVPYVPSAVLLVRRTALIAVGGFDPDLRFGEDVDLVWRLRGAGWRVRYDPRVVVHHRARRTARAGLRQRFDYGTSAAALARRHAGAVVAARLSNAQAVTWSLVATGHPLGLSGALMVAARSTLGLRRVLQQRSVGDAGRWSWRWMLAGHWTTMRQLAAALWRPWWPVALPVSVVSRRCRAVVLAAAAVLAVEDLRWWRRTPALDPVRYVLSVRAGDLAYGAGVWWGAWRHGTWAPLRVDRSAPDRVSDP